MQRRTWRSQTSSSSPSGLRPVKQTRSSIFAGALLPLVLLILPTVGGCCTPTPTETTWPYLPATKPPDRTKQLLRMETGWVDVPFAGPPGVAPPGHTVIPTANLRLLWDDRADQLFYATDLERRGKWRRR